MCNEAMEQSKVLAGGLVSRQRDRPTRAVSGRFRAGGHVSETGHTWTAPPANSMRPLRFAVASCQNWRAGYFQTMRDAVDQGAELMMFVGDYLYEYAVQQLPVGRLIDPDLPAEVVPTTVTRVMLGAERERWFAQGLGAVPARWNIAAQQILMTRLNTAADPEKPATFSAGTWDGYQAGQQRFFDTVAAAEQRGGVRNFVVMSGDVHCSYISDLPRNTLDPTAGVIGAEFTSTSITSALDFDPKANEARQVRRRLNPTLKWADLHCGYVLADLTADRMAVDVRVVER